METEELKRIVDGKDVEQLTTQLCRHWEVATERLEGLVQELTSDMDTCVEAEMYVASMRMQRAIMTLMELSKLPSTFLFSEYLDRITKTMTNTRLRHAVVALTEHLLGEEASDVKPASFFDFLIQSLSQHFALPKEQQKALEQQSLSQQYLFSLCAQYLKPDDLMMMLSVLQNIKEDEGNMSQGEIIDFFQEMRQTMDALAEKMGESLQTILINLLILTVLPGVLVGMLLKSRADSKGLALLFNKVLTCVRESKAWKVHWKDRKDTLHVVNDSSSWKDTLMAERSKERAELGQIPGGLFAKWTTNAQAFEKDFLSAGLSDDALRHFIYHLAVLTEIARELDPKTKAGEEKLVNNEREKVAEAVLTAARMLSDLVKDAWFPHYDDLWKDLIQDETIFANLKVTRKSPHNNLFTARFFCHLVGGLKKMAVFDGHSDADLAYKLTDKYARETYRKNIQEGLGGESEKINNSFNAIYKKYRELIVKR